MKESILDAAIAFACHAHAGANRKGTDIPYIVHPVEVMKIVCTITPDEEIRAAAVLHDTVEDTGTSKEDITLRFGSRVANLVAAESEDKREGSPEKETWRIRKQETLDHLEGAGKDAKIICLGDKLANMRDIARDYDAIGDTLWERFNAPETDAQGKNRGLTQKIANIGWYYRGVASKLETELADTQAWKELDRLIAEVLHC